MREREPQRREDEMKKQVYMPPREAFLPAKCETMHGAVQSLSVLSLPVCVLSSSPPFPSFLLHALLYLGEVC